MTCPKCHSLMCYVCKAKIRDYSHFDQTPANSPAKNLNRKFASFFRLGYCHADRILGVAAFYLYNPRIYTSLPALG